MDECRIGGRWSRPEIERFLGEYRGPLRLAVSTESGFPLICSLWFDYHEGKIVCATARTSKIAECILASPKCGFEVAPNDPPYFGVRGRAVASIASDGANRLLEKLVVRYLGSLDSRFAKWLLERDEDEVIVELDLRWITSWDYRERMSR